MNILNVFKMRLKMANFKISPSFLFQILMVVFFIGCCPKCCDVGGRKLVVPETGVNIIPKQKDIFFDLRKFDDTINPRYIACDKKFKVDPKTHKKTPLEKSSRVAKGVRIKIFLTAEEQDILLSSIAVYRNKKVFKTKIAGRILHARNFKAKFKLPKIPTEEAGQKVYILNNVSLVVYLVFQMDKSGNFREAISRLSIY